MDITYVATYYIHMYALEMGYIDILVMIIVKQKYNT